MWVGTFSVSGHLCGCIYKELLTGAARIATEASGELSVLWPDLFIYPEKPLLMSPRLDTQCGFIPSALNCV